MNYHHSRNQSVEILRRALKYMGQQPAPFTPPNYAIWYEHISGVNPSLSAAMDEVLLEHGSGLTDDMVRKLHARHIVGRDVQAFEITQQRLRSLVEETVTDVTATRITVVSYDETVRACFGKGADIGSEELRKLAEHTEILVSMVGEVATRLDSYQRRAVTALEELEKAQTDPERDPLTRLPTLRGLEVEASRLTSGLEGWHCLAIDLDNFKTINDTYGHVQGDKVLILVAEILNEAIGLIRADRGRVGGEEFLVLLPPMLGDNLPKLSLAELIRREVERIRVGHGKGAAKAGVVTVSIGVAIGRINETFEELRHRADDLMYRAKHSGGNRIMYSNEAAQ